MGKDKKAAAGIDTAEQRKAERKQAQAAAQKKEKQKNIIITVCVILAAVLVLSLVAYNRLAESGALLRGQIAAESENFEVTGTMMAYFFNMNLQNYSPYFSTIGIDSSKSLKSQSYSENGDTWFDYFVTMTKEYVNEVLSLCEAAKANGNELTDADYASVDETINSIKDGAKSLGYTPEQYLAMAYGSGVNLKDVEKCLELTALASSYSDIYTDSLSYTVEEMQTYCDENPESFDGIDYLGFTVSASDFTEYDENNNPTSDTAADSAKAKEAAEAIAKATSEDEFKALVIDYLKAHHDDHEEHDENEFEEKADNCFYRHALASSIPDISEWAFAAKAGETTVDGKEGDAEFTAYYIVKPSYRDETQNRNVRHILFSNDTYEDRAKADEVYAEWEAAGFSDEKFKELEDKYNEDGGSADNGGVYEEVSFGQTDNAFNAWLFDSARKVGDHDIVEGIYGWHIMEYIGEGKNLAWQTNAEQLMKKRDYEAIITKHSESIVYNDGVISEIDA